MEAFGSQNTRGSQNFWGSVKGHHYGHLKIDKTTPTGQSRVSLSSLLSIFFSWILTIFTTFCWAAHSMVWPPLKKSKEVFLVFQCPMIYISVSGCCAFSCHWAPMKRVCIFYSLTSSGIYIHYWLIFQVVPSRVSGPFSQCCFPDA